MAMFGQILPSSTIRNVWRTARRTWMLDFALKGLSWRMFRHLTHFEEWRTRVNIWWIIVYLLFLSSCYRSTIGFAFCLYYSRGKAITLFYIFMKLLRYPYYWSWNKQNDKSPWELPLGQQSEHRGCPPPPCDRCHSWLMRPETVLIQTVPVIVKT